MTVTDGELVPGKHTYLGCKTQPLCNRPAGHEGPHRVHDRRTFAVRLEWPATD